MSHAERESERIHEHMHVINVTEKKIVAVQLENLVLMTLMDTLSGECTSHSINDMHFLDGGIGEKQSKRPFAASNSSCLADSATCPFWKT
jgi:hypothetical protein